MKKVTLGVLLSMLTLPAHSHQMLSTELLITNSQHQPSMLKGSSQSDTQPSFGFRLSHWFSPFFSLETGLTSFAGVDKNYTDQHGNEYSE